MRVYVPATVDMLWQLNESGELTARSGYGFMVTPAVRDFFIEGDEEDFSEYVFDDASRASLRLLATGEVEKFPHRRVVISIDVPDSVVTYRPELGESVVSLDPPTFSLQSVAAIHVDVESSEAATRKAIAVIDAADLGDEDAELTVGDALANYLAWFDPSELGVIVELL
ncbi:DUF6912 family protein [uncultured Corynebacterium sp.]|jgi:hypothetical protein|uniref:DUF6912 family protein n=1 Tax=uncultured Corynebacterium sp. TaxID=159447 RepID=UPI0028D0966D|nr:hypothetical protein [uncultured Corynebacterium sp.]